MKPFWDPFPPVAMGARAMSRRVALSIAVGLTGALALIGRLAA